MIWPIWYYIIKRIISHFPWNPKNLMKQKTICNDINYNNIVLILCIKIKQIIIYLFIYLLIIIIVKFSLLNFLFSMERFFIKKSYLQHHHRSCVAFSRWNSAIGSGVIRKLNSWCWYYYVYVIHGKCIYRICIEIYR